MKNIILSIVTVLILFLVFYCYGNSNALNIKKHLSLSNYSSFADTTQAIEVENDNGFPGDIII